MSPTIAECLEHARQCEWYAARFARFMKNDATIAPVNDVAQVLEDVHIAARENIISLHDPELDDRLRMQNVVGKLSRTPGSIRSTGPRLGEHNSEMMIAELGYSERDLATAGMTMDTPADEGGWLTARATVVRQAGMGFQWNKSKRYSETNCTRYTSDLGASKVQTTKSKPRRLAKSLGYYPVSL